MILSGWFGIGVPVGLVLSILYWFDLGRALRNTHNPNKALRVLGLLMGLPQALFGAFVAAVGLAIAAWVIYNSLWERDPHYTGGLLAFGMSPLFVLFGSGLVADSFRRTSRHEA
jgi:hypothetical protein